MPQESFCTYYKESLQVHFVVLTEFLEISKFLSEYLSTSVILNLTQITRWCRKVNLNT